MLTAEGYLNYRQEPRVHVRDVLGYNQITQMHFTSRDARAFAAELIAAADAAESLRRLADIAEDAHDSRKAEGM